MGGRGREGGDGPRERLILELFAIAVATSKSSIDLLRPRSKSLGIARISIQQQRKGVDSHPDSIGDAAQTTDHSIPFVPLLLLDTPSRPDVSIGSEALLGCHGTL